MICLSELLKFNVEAVNDGACGGAVG
jgi:hypothetical protein